MWNRKNTTERVERALDTMQNVAIAELASPGQLQSIGTNEAFRVDAAHGYVELLNAPDLVEPDAAESERSHKRLLRFLQVYQRVAPFVLSAAGALAVDYQHHRLHFVVVEPRGDERERIARAVTVADTLRTLISGANEIHAELPDARIRVGIDAGRTLAVRNGTRGDREPLFIGNAANHAAKLLAAGQEGAFLTNAARRAFDPSWSCGDPVHTPLDPGQVTACVLASGVRLDVGALLARWRAEVHETPLQDFSFVRPRPPLADLDFESLAPGNSRRIEAALIYADLDGFTCYVAERVTRRRGEEAAVRALHVLRKELREVLRDFGGRKIRYIGDCLVGWLAEGPSETDKAQTVSQAVLCAAAMRDAFGVVQDRLPDTAGLGLAIGVDAGAVSVTRLGLRGARFRCAVGRAVGGAEAAQQRCAGTETALGEGARAWAGSVVTEIFPDGRPQRDVTYNRVQALLDLRGGVGGAVVSAIPTIRPRAWGTDA